MNDDNSPSCRAGGAPGRSQGKHCLPLLALLIVIAGVLTAAAAAFAFSYPGVHDIARAAGVQTGLARFYPALPDALLVVACAAALALRRAHWWARLLPWLSIIAIVALVGAADAAHAMAIELPLRSTEAAVAVLPWALLLLSLQLWLSMLRNARNEQPPPAASAGATEPVVPEPAMAEPGGASTAVANPAVTSTAVASTAVASTAVASTAVASTAVASTAVASQGPKGAAVDGPAVASPVVPSPVVPSPAMPSPVLALAANPDNPPGNQPDASSTDANSADASSAERNSPATSPAERNSAEASPAYTKSAEAGRSDGQAPPSPGADSTVPGGHSSSATFSGLDLILPPYPDEPDSHSEYDIPPWRVADQERADPTEAGLEHVVGSPHDRTADPGPELAIDADPAPDDPTSDESHAIGDEMPDDRHRLIGEGHALGHLSVQSAVTSVAPDLETEHGPAFPAPPLSAPVPESALLEPADRAAEEGDAQSHESRPRPHGTKDLARQAAQSAQETRTRAPQAAQPDASAREPAQPDARQPGGDKPGTPQAEPAQAVVAAQEPDARELQKPRSAADGNGPGTPHAEPAHAAVAAQEPDARELQKPRAAAYEDGNGPGTPHAELALDASEKRVPESSGDFPRVHSSPVPPKSERRTRRRP